MNKLVPIHFLVPKIPSFDGTLSGVALDWFSGLVDGPIARFDEILSLFTVIQILDPDERMVVASFYKGLHVGPFDESLVRQKSKTMVDIQS
ncbi:hypothetical protein JHK82_043096 [Glycine max]|nr:hypothetical protein JHK86_043129 [Glycine max]KAG5106126.1 hypothetical protein JHK82_043096 [Glycine max]KAG5117206.1 hypothetical protein JHK84_043319 [Glycine max]